MNEVSVTIFVSSGRVYIYCFIDRPMLTGAVSYLSPIIVIRRKSYETIHRAKSAIDMCTTMLKELYDHK